MGERGRTLTLSSYRHSFSKEIVELPGTFDEFLASFNLDDWPKTPHLPDLNPYPLVSRIKNDYPADTVARYLYDNAPMPHEIISRLERRIDECKLQVQEHAKHVFTLESEKSEQPGQVDVISPPESQDTSKKNMKIERKFSTEAPQDSRNKDLENFSFPGFNLWKLTKLPNNLEPARIWDSVLKVQIFKGVNSKVLKQLFFSEASLAILQDSFWWWFLHKFQPDQDEQDHFFDRISDSYVTLLWSIPNYIKDAFLQMYPDCLSQAIYLAFWEALPHSCHRFDDQFKDELMDLIFQWIRGFKPQKFAWKNWKCPSTEKTEKSTVEKESFSQISSHMKLQPRRRTMSRSRSRSRSTSRSRTKTLRFQVTTEEQIQKPAQETKESHYVGDGPDFQHSLFNLGGQSPLVSYYLQMHGIPNTLANSRGYRINHSEICKVPHPCKSYPVIKLSDVFSAFYVSLISIRPFFMSVSGTASTLYRSLLAYNLVLRFACILMIVKRPLSPTYMDLIQKCKKTSRKLLDNFADFEHKCGAELVVLQEKREKADRKFRRMLQTITTKPTEKRVKTERFLFQMANAKINHRGSCGPRSGAKEV